MNLKNAGAKNSVKKASRKHCGIDLEIFLGVLLLFCSSVCFASSTDSSANNKMTNEPKYSIGIKGGSSQSFITWHSLPEIGAACDFVENRKVVSSFAVGLQSNFKISQQFYLQPEIYFSQKAGSLSFVSEGGLKNERKWVTDDIFKMQNLDVNLLLHFRTLGEKVFFFTTAGVYYSSVP